MICKLDELKNLFNTIPLLGDEKLIVNGVSTDTRSLKNDEIFVAIKGENFDGHDFVAKAIEIGAMVIIVSRKFDISNYKYDNFIIVDDTVKAYGEIARFYRLRNRFKVVAITGSSGKTTTKDMVATVLSIKYKVEKTYKNNNNEIGLPFTILSADSSTEVLVLEMGMRALGEIEYLTKISVPDIGIITNVGVAHIGELGSKENILNAKGELLDNLSNSAIAIINGEDGATEELSRKFNGEIKIFGFNDNATIRALNVDEEQFESKIHIERNGISKIISLPYKGKHLILDSLIAIEVGLQLGISIEDSVTALSNMEVSPGRLELIKKDKYVIINDTYNANPDSMKKSLEVLFSYSGNKIAVLGDMRELGINENKYHEEIGSYLINKDLSALITVGRLGKHIGLGLEKAGNKHTKIFSYEGNIDAGLKLKEIINQHDIVLIKGSRAMAMEEIIKILEEEDV